MSISIESRVEAARFALSIAESPPADRGELLTQKLESVVTDPDLTVTIGGYVLDLVVPSLIGQHKLTPEQGERIRCARVNMMMAINAELADLGREG